MEDRAKLKRKRKALLHFLSNMNKQYRYSKRPLIENTILSLNSLDIEAMNDGIVNDTIAKAEKVMDEYYRWCYMLDMSDSYKKLFNESKEHSI